MRYYVLDSFRALVIVSMIAYHACWDATNIFGAYLPFFWGSFPHVWQQSVCWSFILLSGFCCGLSRKPLKRGAIVFAAGALVTVVTVVFMPEEQVICGILTFIGAAMMVFAGLRPWLEKAQPVAGLVVCCFLFFVLRDIQWGYFGFESLRIAEAPGFLYNGGWVSFFLGFDDGAVPSSDYFAFFPWIFLYMAGFFIFQLWPKQEGGEGEDASSRPQLRLPQTPRVPVLNWVGEHSLLVYLVHQPLVYGLIYAAYSAGLL